MLHITRADKIARRYFVTNGFDGALTMLGLCVGFYVSDNTNTSVIISACLGAAIALGMSGVSSAYISETAERKKELHELEKAMMTNLDKTTHGRAAQLAPFIIAFINGLAPFIISIIIIFPLWWTIPEWLVLDPLEVSITVAFIIVFFLGVFLGKISGTFWLWTGIRAVLIALVITLLILSF